MNGRCQDCDKPITAKNLARHYRQVHFKERLFECSLCTQAFGSKWALRRHTDAKHFAQVRVHHQVQARAALTIEEDTTIIDDNVPTIEEDAPITDDNASTSVINSASSSPYQTCPVCSSTRRDLYDFCLHVIIDHHGGFGRWSSPFKRCARCLRFMPINSNHQC